MEDPPPPAPDLGPRLRALGFVARSFLAIGSTLAEGAVLWVLDFLPARLAVPAQLPVTEFSFRVSRFLLGEMHPALYFFHLVQGRRRLFLGAYAAAADRLGLALEVLEENNPEPEGNEDLPEVLGDLALAQREAGRPGEALDTLGRLRRLHESPGRGRDEVLADLLTEIGAVHEGIGQLPEARAHYEEAVAIYRSLPGPPPGLYAPLGNLGSVLAQLGEYAAAAEAMDQGLELLRAAEGRDQLATALGNRANLSFALGDHATAAAGHREARELEIALHGENHPAVARADQNIGAALLEAGDLAGAGEHFARAHRVYLDFLGPDHPRTGACQMNSALVALRRGELDVAEDHLAEVERVFSESLQDFHPWRALLECNRGLLRAAQGRPDEAEARFRSALEIAEMPGILEDYVGFLEDQGRAEDAAEARHRMEQLLAG